MELDRGRPVIIDIGRVPESGKPLIGRTMLAVGYDKETEILIAKYPAISAQGILSIRYDRLKDIWHSR